MAVPGCWGFAIVLGRAGWSLVTCVNVQTVVCDSSWLLGVCNCSGESRLEPGEVCEC